MRDRFIGKIGTTQPCLTERRGMENGNSWSALPQVSGFGGTLTGVGELLVWNGEHYHYGNELGLVPRASALPRGLRQQSDPARYRHVPQLRAG